MIFLWIAGGLVGLVVGGELLVRGAVALAERLGVSPLMIGLTLVGFGTSTPELVTSLQAALAGSPGIAVGNVVGSNIANILLILGIAALLKPVATTAAAFRRDGTVLVIASLLGLWVVLAGSIGRGTGAVFVVLLLAYIVVTYLLERGDSSPSAQLHKAEAESVHVPPSLGTAAALAMLAGGLVLTILGARYLVFGAVDLARDLGVSETVIGLTIVAVGTSMPELVTSVMAARRGQSDVAFGNIVGSNIYNILGILGVTALVTPLAVPPEIARVDIWVMLAATAALVAAAVTGWRINRLEGGLLLAAYCAYLGYLTASATGAL
jgi:cation:H+ antiporter